MLCLLLYGYRTYSYYINCDKVIIGMLSLLIMCIQYFIFCKNVYIMNFTTAVTADIIAYLVVMTFF